VRGPVDIRTLVKREKPTEEIAGMEEMPHLFYLREMYEKRIKSGSIQEADPKVLIRRFTIARIFAKLMMPLLRFEGLFSKHFRVGLELFTSQAMTPDIWAAIAPGQKPVREMFEELFDTAEDEKKPIVWTEWCLSSDLIHAFDAQPFIPEALVALLYPIGLEPNEKLIDFAEQAGVPPEYCSASRNAIGSYISGQIPDPECIVTVSHPCDSMVSSYQTLEYLTGAPTYRLDTPYWDDKRSLDYYAEDVRSLIVFLEEHLDRKLDYDRLREVLDEVNKTNEILIEINELLKATPCPGSGMLFGLLWFFREIGRGLPEMTETSRNIYKVIRKRVDAGKGSIKKEKIRVIWFDVPIAFYPLVTWMEEVFGAVVVMDLVGYVNSPPIDTSTPESMTRGLAASYMNLAMARQFHGPLDLFERDLVKVCEEYNGDCFIFAGHAGCKHGWASVRHLKEYMKKIDMPLLVLTSDIFDQRLTNDDQLKAQVEEFFVNNGLVS